MMQQGHDHHGGQHNRVVPVHPVHAGSYSMGHLKHCHNSYYAFRGVNEVARFRHNLEDWIECFGPINDFLLKFAFTVISFHFPNVSA